MSHTEKLLSVVIPTLNRRHLLEKTLTWIINELSGHEDCVELVVINNSSDDNTIDFLESWQKKHPVKIISFEKRVNIDESFERCIKNSCGKYINIFGDDDLPIPGFLSRVLNCLKKNDDIGLIYLNRLIGNIDLSFVGEVAHPNHGIDEKIYSCNEFISKFTHWPGFISSLIFSRETWIKGEKYYQDKYLGYKFLARVYAGCNDKTCIYIGAPALVQRRGQQAWKSQWPRYWLVNMPKMLADFDRSGVSKGALLNWQKYEVKSFRFFIDCFVAKAFGYSKSDQFWSEAASFQKNRLRLGILIFFQYIFPSRVAKAIYFSIGKYRD